jgi:SAM-dependent methyltransferase
VNSIPPRKFASGPETPVVPALPPLDSMADRLCAAACRLFIETPLRRFTTRNRAQNERFESKENYLADRISNVDRYERLFSRFATFHNKTVLELGCSSGYLLNSFLERQRFSGIGADISPACIATATTDFGDKLRFVQSTAQSIPVADESVDIVYCIDTVEHLSQPHDILMDVYRLMKPGGIFFVHFGPWYNPSGSHLEDIIPFPWPHVLFKMDTLLNVAAHLYERPNYKAACYWYDDKGKRRPNPYLDHDKWREFLNDLTIRKFKKLLKTLPFEQIHFERIGFGGKGYPFAKFLRGLAQVPVLNEYFINFVFCVLRKPQG